MTEGGGSDAGEKIGIPGRIGMLEDDLGHESKVRGEGKEGGTLLLISVDLASYLYQPGKAKGKEGQEGKGT